MKRTLSLAVITILLLISQDSYSQTTYNHRVFWARIIIGDKISDRLKWELYGQKRTQNIPGEKSLFGGPHFMSLWLWFNYSVNNKLNLSVSPFGYFDSHIFFTTPADAELPGVKEYRWTLRAEQIQKFNWFNYSNRYGLEYRIRDLKNDGDYQPNWRVRYMVRLEKPIKGILSREKPLSFFISDEVFIQFGKAVRNNPNVFDQNRITAGASYEVFKNIRCSLSYLNILQQRINGKDFDNANALWIVIAFENIFGKTGKMRVAGKN